MYAPLHYTWHNAWKIGPSLRWKTFLKFKPKRSVMILMSKGKHFKRLLLQNSCCLKHTNLSSNIVNILLLVVDSGFLFYSLRNPHIWVILFFFFFNSWAKLLTDTLEMTVMIFLLFGQVSAIKYILELNH